MYVAAAAAAFLAILSLAGHQAVATAAHDDAGAVPNEKWQHGWETIADMWWADFGYSVFQDFEADFAAQHYKILSFEKCTRNATLRYTEDGIYANAAMIKARNADVKVLFYLATDLGGLGCYEANQTLTAHPEWWLRDDSGVLVQPVTIDHHIPAANEWWLSIPFSRPGTAALIDGVLADGSAWAAFAGHNFSAASKRALQDSKEAMIGELQRRFTALNGGIVLANGVDMYGGDNADPEDPYGLGLLNHTDAIENEHFLAFESVAQNGSFVFETVEQDMQNVLAVSAHNLSKLVLINSWAGPFHGFQKNGFPSWAGPIPAPTTPTGWQAALSQYFTFNVASFLLVADVNTYLSNGVWYELHQGFVECPAGSPQNCCTPPGWYPDFRKPLGAPTGPRQPGPAAHQWTRQFAHADVFVDLSDPLSSTITFH